MYGWIWRHLPFGLPGKIIGSIGLAVAAAALLWYVVFPWAEPLLPFDDVQVSDTGGQFAPGAPGDTGGGAVAPSSAEPSLGENEIPYATHSNNPEPSPSR
jgi:hypothetical protein